MLLFLIILPLIGWFILFFTCKTRIFFIRNFSLFWSLFILNVSISLLFLFDPTETQSQFLDSNQWFQLLNINIILGIDGLALVLIQLTALLIPVCVMLCWNKSLNNQAKDYSIAFFLLESILFFVFSSLDLLVFYILFEAVLIPMYLIIGFYGSRERRIRSSYMLFLYTLISSIIMFIAILFIFFKYGTTNYLILRTIQFDALSEKLIWLAFFSSFAVKMPLVPFHIWLPEAHCEARQEQYTCKRDNRIGVIQNTKTRDDGKGNRRARPTQQQPHNKRLSNRQHGTSEPNIPRSLKNTCHTRTI
jgi:NADH:ubiquinone oxidoreductase subunit 4 (subunit M)